MGEYHNTAIILNDSKEPYLYYPYVIPVYLFNISGILLSDTQGMEASDILTSHLFHHGQLDVEYDEGIEPILPPGFDNGLLTSCVLSFQSSLLSNINLQNSYECLFTDEGPRSFLEICHEAFQHFIGGFIEDNFIVDASNTLFSYPTLGDEPTLVIKSLRLVDVNNISFKHILEFRKDIEAMKKMQRFRLFAYSNYAGKPKAFIEDDILKRWDDYQEAVKEWGFETKQKAVSFVIKAGLVATVGAIAKAFTGSTEMALTTGAAGMLADLGLLKLELSKQRHALDKIAREYPISYISDVKEKLGAL